MSVADAVCHHLEDSEMNDTGAQFHEEEEEGEEEEEEDEDEAAIEEEDEEEENSDESEVLLQIPNFFLQFTINMLSIDVCNQKTATTADGCTYFSRQSSRSPFFQ